MCSYCATMVPAIIVACAGGVEVQGGHAEKGQADYYPHLAALDVF